MKKITAYMVETSKKTPLNIVFENRSMAKEWIKGYLSKSRKYTIIKVEIRQVK